MKRVSWKYLAGLIDGEGCIDMATTKVNEQFYIQPRLRIGMAICNNFLLEMCQLNFGGHMEKERVNENPNWQNARTWALSGYKKACPVLRNVVNHLILKKEQVRLCLWMETNVKGKRLSAVALQSIREELKLMKRDPHRLSEKAQERIIPLL